VPVPTTCGEPFCYAKFSPAFVGTLDLPWEDLVVYAAPSSKPDEETYVEDDSANRERLKDRNFHVNDESADTSAAGYTYVGQLLAHDINFEQSSVLGDPIDPETIPNINTPFVDLDTIYDFNGMKVGELVTALDGDKFSIGETQSGAFARDFVRDSAGAAITLDQRNDQNRIVSQLMVALMTLHNKFVDDGMAFEKARDQTIREWLAVVLHDMLPNLLDADVLAAVAGGDRQLYVDELKAQSAMPVEFATGAFRLSHSRANSLYTVNSNTTARLFDVGNVSESHLAGGSPLTDDLVIEWEHFFGSDAQSSRILDPLYSQSIIRLPIGLPGTPRTSIKVECGDDYEGSAECGDVECPICVDEPVVAGEVRVNLALLDLLRGQTHKLPGGIAFANYIKEIPKLDVVELDKRYLECESVYGLPGDECEACSSCNGLPAFRSYTGSDVPLIWYLAHESVKDHSGSFLGKIGSRIVAETIYGLIEESPVSILGANGTSAWTSRITETATVTVAEILRFIEWW